MLLNISSKFETAYVNWTLSITNKLRRMVTKRYKQIGMKQDVTVDVLY